MRPHNPPRSRGVLSTVFCLFVLGFIASAVAENPIHVTYLWHMHQPVYYPYESVNATDSAGRFNFSVRGVHDARTGAYGEWPKNAVQQNANANLPHGGVQVSFSGSLMENMDGLYGNGWREHYRWGRNGLRTSFNNPRLDLVGIAYHHSLMPLTTKESMRMQIKLHKEAYKDVWNATGYSKGFWPPECAFDVNMIPALVSEGLEWVIVDNGHFDRAAKNYPWSSASSIRPNKADQLNPDPATIGSQWVQLNNVWAPTKVSAPWGYQPHNVQYIDPNSSPSSPNVKRIVAVPAARYEGNENGRGGYGSFKPENVWGSHVAKNNNPDRPMILLCHSDGDNYGMLNADAYNGQHGNFINMVKSNPNFEHTSVQDYLQMYPVPSNDVIHVEPGSWVGIDGGTPYFDKWRENNARDGEHPDFWSWSVLVAAANRVIHADSLENNYSMNDVRWGIGPDTAKAWHFYLQAETSCHWYWDFDRANPWDGNATRGANLAVAEANKVIARNPGKDTVGPTIWPAQRDIYNPGGRHWKEDDYQPSNFNVFTFVDDVSGVSSVKLYWRTDNDGENPINEYDNELYAHNPAKVGAWNTVEMAGDWYPTVKGPKVPDPANRAKRYQAPINGQSNVLVDYFVEATDSKGNVSRSDIVHVWVGTDTGGNNGGGNNGGGSNGGGSNTGTAVTVSPAEPVAGQSVTVTYDPAGRNLASASKVNIHYGYNGSNWTTPPGVAMTKSDTKWSYTYTVPANATTIVMCFNDGSTWDSNSSQNWTFAVKAGSVTKPAAPTGLSASATSTSSIALTWSASSGAASYIVYRNGSQIATPEGTSYADTGLTAATAYTYKVRAVNSAGESTDSATVSATTFSGAIPSEEIIITDPTSSITVPAASYTFKGNAGGSFTNGLTWTNTTSGQGGTIPSPGASATNGWQWSVDIPLVDGTNDVKILGKKGVVDTVTFKDSPTDYGTWNDGDGDTAGFGRWWYNHSATNAGNYLALHSSKPNMTLPSGAIYSGDAKGFGLWANNGGVAKITRSFVHPMKVDDVFKVALDNNWITTGKSVGLELRDSDGRVRLRFYFVGGEQNYRITDSVSGRDSTIPYTDQGMWFQLTLTGDNSYRLEANSKTITGTLGAGSAITWVEFFNESAGSGGDYDFYIGEMSHKTKTTILDTTVTANASVIRNNGDGSTSGIANSWWSQYGISGADREASADYDGDGFTNEQEYALGTNPADSKSRFAVKQATARNNNVTITWSSVEGKKYQLQSRSMIGSGHWSDVGEVFVATSATSLTVVPTSTKQQFYRLRLVP